MTMTENPVTVPRFAAEWRATPRKDRQELARWLGLSGQQVQELEEYTIRSVITEEFGWAATFLDHAELGPLLRQAAWEGWTAQKLQTELRKTKWWQSTTEAQRRWETTAAEDPATAARTVEERAVALQQQAAQMGGNLSTAQAKTLAETALRNGWSEIDVSRALGAELVRSGQTTALRKGIIGTQIAAAASTYGVPLSEETINGWVNAIAQGSAVAADYQRWLVDQAVSMFPALEQDLRRGLTVDQLASPYREVAARTLGVNPATIDFSDPKWNAALNVVDQSGKRRVATLAEWGDMIRRDSRYGYDQSDEAVSKAYTVASEISRAFGRLG
jgi:hypothetical protein